MATLRGMLSSWSLGSCLQEYYVIDKHAWKTCSLQAQVWHAFGIYREVVATLIFACPASGNSTSIFFVGAVPPPHLVHKVWMWVTPTLASVVGTCLGAANWSQTD